MNKLPLICLLAAGCPWAPSTIQAGYDGCTEGCAPSGFLAYDSSAWGEQRCVCRDAQAACPPPEASAFEQQQNIKPETLAVGPLGVFGTVGLLAVCAFVAAFCGAGITQLIRKIKERN